jgi:DNA-binding transcriptional ArsR family regulator
VDQVFQALADRTRRDIVRRTMRDDASVSSLARHYDMSFAAVQKHVAVLARADLVTKRRRGREQLVRCNLDTVRRAQHLLDELESLWLDRLDRFEQLLGTPTESES